MLILTINGMTKNFSDSWEARWDIEGIIDDIVDEEYLEESMSWQPTIEIEGIEFTKFEILKNCADWKIDELLQSEKDYILDEIIYEIEMTDSGEIERFGNLVQIEVIENE